MPPTEQAMRAYNDSRTGVPQALGEVTALLAKGAEISSALAKHSIKLEVTPAPRF